MRKQDTDGEKKRNYELTKRPTIKSSDRNKPSPFSKSSNDNEESEERILKNVRAHKPYYSDLKKTKRQIRTTQLSIVQEEDKSGSSISTMKDQSSDQKSVQILERTSSLLGGARNTDPNQPTEIFMDNDSGMPYLMYQYSHQHEEKILEIEAEIKATIGEWTESEEENSCIQDLWTAEAKKNEQISLQLWYKRLDFLVKMKQEEEETDNIRFINDEQEEEMKKRSYLKKNRFKIRRKFNRPTAISHDDKRQEGQRRKSQMYSDRSTPGYHDNWRLGLMCSTEDQV